MKRFFLPIMLCPLLAMADSVTVSTPETDPIFSAWDKSTGISITESQISDLQSYLTAETDPLSIHTDGTSTTTATVPFAQGVAIPATKELALGAIGASFYPKIYSSSATSPRLLISGAAVSGWAGGTSGEIEILAGSYGALGADLLLKGGTSALSNASGGDVWITPGVKTGSGTTGKIYLDYYGTGGGIYLGSDTGLVKRVAGKVETASAGTDYEAAIAAGTSAQYWRGDKSWQTLNQAAIAGLASTDTPTFAGAVLTDIYDPEYNLNIHLEGGQMSFTADSFVLENALLAMSESGYLFQNQRPTIASTDGKCIFDTPYVPTSGAGGTTISTNFKGSVDLRSITAGTANYNGTVFTSTFESQDANVMGASINFTGTKFTNTIKGNQSAGFHLWSGSMTGVDTAVNFSGNWVTVAGINFYPMTETVTFSATTSASHQIIGKDFFLNYTAANTVNQLYGQRISLGIAGPTISGSAHNFFAQMPTPSGTNTIGQGMNLYTAYGANVASNYNSALVSGKQLRFFNADAILFTYMASREAIAFYTNLANNANNFAFRSDGADGWMAADNSKWIFGAGKDVSIFHDGTNSIIDNITGKLIFKSPTTFEFGSGAAGVDYIIQVNGETNDGVITWMEDEDYFKFGDGIFMDAAEEVFFRATGNKIYSSAADTLDVVSPTINLGGATSNRVNFIAGDGASAPAAGGAAPSPADYFGGDSVMLGDPAEWLEVKINGTTRKIPCY